MTFNYVSLDLVIDQLNSIKLPGQEWNISELKDWTWEALSLIGAVQEFVDTSIEVEILDGKGEIPTNIHSLHSVLEGDSAYNMVELPAFAEFTTLSYKTNAGYIFTDFDKGTVIFNCSVFPVDEEGKPMIPDNVMYIKAVYSFIRMKLGERLMWQKKILLNEFKYLQSEWLFYCPGASNSTKMLSEDGMSNLKTKLLKTFPSYNRNRPTTQRFLNVR